MGLRGALERGCNADFGHKRAGSRAMNSFCHNLPLSETRELLFSA